MNVRPGDSNADQIIFFAPAAGAALAAVAVEKRLMR
jgi:hypothetical protein